MTVLTWPPGALSMGLADLTLGRPPTRWGGRALLALLVEPRCGDSVIDYLWCGLVWWGLLSSPANAGLLTAAPAPTSDIAMNTVAATFLPKLLSMSFPPCDGNAWRRPVESVQPSCKPSGVSVHPPLVLVPSYSTLHHQENSTGMVGVLRDLGI